MIGMSTLCASVFCCCDKMPDTVNLKGEEGSFRLGFQEFQSCITWLHYLGVCCCGPSWWKVQIERATHLMVARKEREREIEGKDGTRGRDQHPTMPF